MRFQILTAFILFNIASLCWADLQVGVGKRMVTPDPPLPVSGGIGPSHPATRKLGDLWVRAMVLEKDDTRVAIVGCDFLGFPKVLGDRVRGQVKAIPAENIIIGVTHTHSAPDMYGFPDEEGNFSTDLEYVNWVCEQMASAISDALSNMQPASLKIATDEAQGRIAFNYYAPKLYDPRCSIIQAVDQEGKAIVTLVNYAIHPEVLGPDQGICSPDLIGPFYQRIEEKTGGMAIFMNGAQGGMVTADVRDPETGEHIQTWEECQRIGNLLADEALRIVEDAPLQKDPGLECYARSFTFPIDSELIRLILKLSPLGYKTNPDGSAPTQVNLINLGNAQILTIPGEALPNIGYYLKRKMHGEHNLLFGLTNDAFGYIMTKVDWNSFERYDYISRTCLGEMTGEIFIEGALQFLEAHVLSSYDKAIQLHQEGRREEAASELDKFLADNPRDAKALALKGRLLLESGHLSEAINICEQALEIDPSSAEAHANLGTALRLQAKDNQMDPDGYAEAIRHLKEAIRLDPGSFVGHVELGYAYRDLRQFPEAIEALEKAIAIKPRATRPRAVLRLIKAGKYDQ